MKDKKFLKILLFTSFVLVAFFIRAALTTVINKGDVLAIEEWSRSLYQEGAPGSYFRYGWVYTFPTQPPLMMALYWFSRWLYENRYFLAILHNLIRFPPAFVLVWLAKNGPFFFVRLWGILADCLAAVFVYRLLKKNKAKDNLLFPAFTFLLFNPLTIFVSSIWGQVDILGCFLAFASFFVFEKEEKKEKNWVKIASPFLFIMGAMIKPTVLLLLPLYLFFMIRKYFSAQSKKYFFLPTAGILLSAVIIFVSFIPFWDRQESFSRHLNSVLARRILPSAKGVSKVATSAYTFFTIPFEIDKTPGSLRLGFFTLDQLGNFAFVAINVLAALAMKKRQNQGELYHLSFLGYFVAEGAFLFRTNMAERYFLPAFLFLYLFFFLTKDAKIRLAIIFQFLVWFFNLVSSFFLSDNYPLQLFLRHNHYLGTRVVSLFNVLVFFYLVYRYFSFNKTVALKKT